MSSIDAPVLSAVYELGVILSCDDRSGFVLYNGKRVSFTPTKDLHLKVGDWISFVVDKDTEWATVVQKQRENRLNSRLDADGQLLMTVTAAIAGPRDRMPGMADTRVPSPWSSDIGFLEDPKKRMVSNFDKQVEPSVMYHVTVIYIRDYQQGDDCRFVITDVDGIAPDKQQHLIHFAPWNAKKYDEGLQYYQSGAQSLGYRENSKYNRNVVYCGIIFRRGVYHHGEHMWWLHSPEAGAVRILENACGFELGEWVNFSVKCYDSPIKREERSDSPMKGDLKERAACNIKRSLKNTFETEQFQDSPGAFEARVRVTITISEKLVHSDSVSIKLPGLGKIIVVKSELESIAESRNDELQWIDLLGKPIQVWVRFTGEAIDDGNPMTLKIADFVKLVDGMN